MARFALVFTSALFLAGALAAQDASSRPAAETRTDTRGANSRPSHVRLGVTCDQKLLVGTGVAKVNAVVAGSPAEKGGVQVGDVIEQVDGQAVTSDAAYRSILGSKKADQEITISLKRADKAMQVKCKLAADKAKEPDEVTVQHCLIAFDGAQADKKVTRTKADAEKLANEIANKVRSGQNFDAIIREMTDDPGSKTSTPPGKYVLANTGTTVADGAIKRDGMVGGFSTAAFALAVGQVYVVAYDKELSPYGYHVMLRLK